MSFNPKVKEFLLENQNKGMIGFAWSLYWRLLVAMFGIYLVFMLVCLVLVGTGKIFE
jgi:hypothetical protein